MFVDLMSDIANTFTERFLRVQVMFNPPPDSGDGRRRGPDGPRGRDGARAPTKRYNALGILEDVPADEGADAALDVGPGEPPANEPVVKSDPVVVGAGKVRPLGATQPMARSPRTGAGTSDAGGDWSSVGRNDPCPCGSGKKFKKCHGAGV